MKNLIKKILKEDLEIKSVDSVFVIVNHEENAMLWWNDDDGGYEFIVRHGPVTPRQVIANSFSTEDWAKDVFSVFKQQREEAAEWDESEDYSTDKWTIVEYMMALEPIKDMDNFFNV